MANADKNQELLARADALAAGIGHAHLNVPIADIVKQTCFNRTSHLPTLAWCPRDEVAPALWIDMTIGHAVDADDTRHPIVGVVGAVVALIHRFVFAGCDERWLGIMSLGCRNWPSEIVITDKVIVRGLEPINERPAVELTIGFRLLWHDPQVAP